jgi:hypothetical protein
MNIKPNFLPGRLIMLFAMFLMVFQLSGQEDKVMEEIKAEPEDGAATLSFGADLMSRYVWRGSDYGNSPAIQPAITFSWKGLNIGAWGSYAFGSHLKSINSNLYAYGGHYAEMDLFASYTYKWFTVMVFDYFTVDVLEPNGGNKYFDYANATTSHTLEGSLIVEGGEKFPIEFLIGTLFYGADKGKGESGEYGEGEENNYSTYLELGYTFDFVKTGISVKPFIGGIPFGSGWYGPYAGVTNLGLTARKEIGITDRFSLPVQVSLITNPQAQSVFLVFGLSL